MTNFTPDFLIANPGAILEEWLEEKGLTISDFAIEVRYSEIFVSEFIEGMFQINADFARSLEMVTGISVETWSGLEKLYWGSSKF